MKTTLATIASVEARLPVQAQQILRQVSQEQKNTPQPEKKSSKGALELRKRQLEPQVLFLSRASMPPSFHPRRLAASQGRSCATLHSTCTGSDRR